MPCFTASLNRSICCHMGAHACAQAAIHLHDHAGLRVVAVIVAVQVLTLQVWQEMGASELQQRGCGQGSSRRLQPAEGGMRAHSHSCP